MDKKIIIKHLEGRATSEEKEMLLEWIKKNPDNREYFSKQRDLFLFASMAEMETTEADMVVADEIMKGAQKQEFVKSSNKPNRKIGKIMYYGVAAAVFVALCINIFMMSVRGDKEIIKDNRVLLSGIPKDFIHTIYTNRGVKGEVELPDGSKVKLNSDSKIIFPDKFSGSTREVYISGEAYFNVVTNSDTPMVVSTNRNILVKVYGTEFNIRSYENEHNARTTLFKGKIDLITKNRRGEEKVLAALNPLESFVVRDQERPLHIMKADTLKQGAWRYGNLLFELTPMDEVIRELERWHGADVSVKDKSIYDLKFSANFKQESLVQILEILKFCSDIDYELDENKVTLFYKNKKGV